MELPKGRCKKLTPRTTVIVLGENNPRKGKSALAPSSLSNTSKYEEVIPDSYLSKALALGVGKWHSSTKNGLKSMVLHTLLLRSGRPAQRRSSAAISASSRAVQKDPRAIAAQNQTLPNTSSPCSYLSFTHHLSATLRGHSTRTYRASRQD
jgi:hypothetical protein